VTLAAVVSAPLPGQRLAPTPPRWEPELRWAPQLRSATTARTSRLFPPAPDYRWEGLLVGGVLVGAFGAALGNGFCGYDEIQPKGSCVWPTVEGFAIGAVVGGVTGGLLGSLMPKAPPSPDSSEHH
jgi:hypothetical protein